MNKEELINTLQQFDNDPNFNFDAPSHKYTYNGEHFISATQFISRFHRPFETDKWSRIKAKQRGISQSEMLAEWKQINDRANEIGTATHNYIENYFNGLYQKLPTDLDVIDRINKFNNIYAKHLYKLEPVKFEQRIFSKKHRIAGMIDSIFTYNDSILLLDWKTNKDFTDDNHPKGKYEKLLEPFSELWKNHLNEYSIQLSIYMLILKEYGINIKQSYLMHIGPNQEPNLHRCLNLVDLLEEYLINNPI